LQQAEIAAGQRSFGNAARERDDAIIPGYEETGCAGNTIEATRALGLRKYSLEVLPGECRHARPGHWTVKSDDTGELSNCIQYRGDVREPDHDSRPGGESLVIDAIQQPDGAIAAAYAPDRVYGRIAQRSVEVGKSLVVSAGKVTIPSVGIFA
jgi:hypothetical protein